MTPTGYLPKNRRSLRGRHDGRQGNPKRERIFALIAERNVILSNSSRPAVPPMRIASQESDNLRLPIEQVPPHSRC
jgi:hypothetical protein